MSQAQQGQIIIPGADTEPLGSIQQLLASNLGREVVAEFVIGMEERVQKSGVLSAVQTDYLVLFDDVNLVDIVCDLYSLKFVTFYLPGMRPGTGARGNAETNAGSAQVSPGESGGGVRQSPENRETATATLAALNYAKRKARKLD